MDNLTNHPTRIKLWGQPYPFTRCIWIIIFNFKTLIIMSKKMFNGLALVAISMYVGSSENPAEPDKNGRMPVLLNPLAGAIPSKRILAGTVASNAGLVNFDDDGNSVIVHRNALVAFTEGEEDPEFGRQFNFTVAGADLSALEIISAQKDLGAGSIVDVMETSTGEAEKTTKKKVEVNVG